MVEVCEAIFKLKHCYVHVLFGETGQKQVLSLEKNSEEWLSCKVSLSWAEILTHKENFIKTLKSYVSYLDITNFSAFQNVSFILLSNPK